MILIFSLRNFAEGGFFQDLVVDLKDTPLKIAFLMLKIWKISTKFVLLITHRCSGRWLFKCL